jgi:soluble lytic murein transglycosylase-like protein
MRFFGVLCLLTAGTAMAGEFAVLSTGSRLHADRHEADGARIRLYSGGGYIELDASQVQRFEAEDAAPTPPAIVKAPVAAEPAAPAPTPSELADAAADKYGLPRSLVRSVMHAESGFQPHAVSPKGAIGLMQLMPETAKVLGVDPHDSAQNVDAGTRYLRDLLIKYNFGLWHALAAYNAGEGAVQKYNGVPPYRETVEYVKRIEREYKKSSGSN